MGQYASRLSNWTVRAITRALKWPFFTANKKNWNFFCFDFKKGPYLSQILLKLWLIGNRTSCLPIQAVIILVIKQIGILLITRMITDRIGLHSVLWPLLITIYVRTCLGRLGKIQVLSRGVLLYKVISTPFPR